MIITEERMMKKLIVLAIFAMFSTPVMSDTIINNNGTWEPYDCPASGSCHMACIAEVKSQEPPGDSGDCRTTFMNGMQVEEKCNPLGSCGLKKLEPEKTRSM